MIKATDKDALKKFVSAFQAEKIAIFPTDTVYGLGGLLTNKTAEKIFKIKNRNSGKPLPLLIADLKQALSLTYFSPETKKAAKKFWPGPVTLVLKAKMPLSSSICKKGKVALRIPDHPFLRRAIRKAGQPIIGTSANLSGEKPPAEISEINKNLLKKIDLVIDGGRISGKSSAIYDFTVKKPRLIRP